MMKLLSFGEIIWDVYPDGKALGGASLNLAAHAALLGCDAWLLSAVGNDALGDEALCEISELGIHTELIAKVLDKPTGRCNVTLDENGIPSYELMTDTAYDLIPCGNISSYKFNVLAFGTLAMRGEKNRSLVKSLLREEIFDEIYADLNLRKPFYDPESVDLCLSSATVVKISSEELPEVMRCICEPFSTEKEAAKRLSQMYKKLKLIVITLGERGSFCYSARDKLFFECAAERVTAVSTVGAGDSFGAAFLAEYFCTGSIEDALSLASRLSGFVVSRTGAVPADTRDHLRDILGR